ncbi:MAG: hypothetical protein GY940_07795 [bacterium]|nr:hypothetical protein [bacterium]
MANSNKRKILTLWTSVIMAGILLLIFIDHKDMFNKSSSYQYGDKIEKLDFKDTDNNKVKLEEGYWYLMVLANGLERNFGFIKYIDHLLEDKFTESGLKVFVFSGEANVRAREFAAKNSISIPIFPTQTNHSNLRRLFKSAHKHRAVGLIEPSGKLVFVSDFIRENDVRQILEKHLKGRIDYSRKGKNKLKVGDLFTSIEVIDLKSGEDGIIDKESSPRLWLIFTSNCVACALKSILESYSGLQGNLLTKLKVTKGLIFSHFFNMDDLKHRLGELNITDDSYLSKAELAGIENNYYKSPNSDDNVVAVITDPGNRIVYKESYPKFLNHLKGDYFEKNKHLFRE